MKSLIDKLVREWAYKVNNGMPDPMDRTHTEVLAEVFRSFNYSEAFISEYICQLNEQQKFQARSKETGQIVDYGSKETMEKAIKDGTHKPIDIEDEKDTTQKVDPQALSAKDGDFERKAGKEDTEDTDNTSKENKKVIDDFETRINDRVDGLTDNQSELVKEASKKIKVLFDETASKDEQTAAAQWLVDETGFSANAMPKSGKRKAYLNKLGGGKKILGNGTNSTEALVQKMESLVELRQFNAKSVKLELSSAAKPDLGDENIVKPKKGSDDPVTNYFKAHPILQKIRGGLHGIYAVKNKDGSVKMPSSEHSTDYLAQSFRSPSLQNTINVAKKQAAAGNLDESVANSLEKHQQNLENVLKNVKIPSKEAREAIANSYNDLMVELHEADPDVASSILKQIAENNLYEQELANGEEVYLPSAGNFPAGDKIKGGTTERVSLISCKFGKSGRIYGCPANSKTICELHQDPSKQNNQGQYLGEEGHTLLINDKLIKGESKEETKEKTANFIKTTLGDPEVNLGTTFSNEEIDEISELTSEYMDEIDKIKKEVADSNPADKEQYWKRFGKKLAKFEGKYKKRLGKIITVEKASELIGENNAKNLVQKAGVKVEALLSAIEIANNIRTNKTLLELEHNKQYYDKDNKPQFVTSKGTNNPDDYSITFRTKRTAGRTGGGCQLSFTGDGKAAENNIQSDGSLTNAQTGEEVEV